MTYKISVTQEHINRGKREDCAACPIALAAHEHDYLRCALILRDSVWVHGVKLTTLPIDARQFMTRFDKHCVVHPLTFDLNVSDEAIAEVKYRCFDGH